MNIIFYRYNSICEPDYITAFSRLGIDVVEDRDGMEKKISLSDRLTKLGNMICENNPLFIFSINYFPFLSILCEKLKILYVAETVDCPVFEIFHNSIRNKFNRVFLFDKEQFLSVRDENPECIFYLPLGAPCERNTALLGNEYYPEYDISFVGSLYIEKDNFNELNLSSEKKDKLLEKLKEQIKESSHGMKKINQTITNKDVMDIKNSSKVFFDSSKSVSDLDKFVVLNDYLAPHMAFIERVQILNEIADKSEKSKVHLFTRSDTSMISKKVVLHEGVRSLDQMPRVFRNSRINLNICLRSIQTGLPQRIWDVLSCRGFLITNDQPEIKDYFEIGVHLETYSNHKELIEKIKYYSEHEDERLKIAQDGYDVVLQKHTVLLRTAEMIKKIFNN